MKLFKTPSYTKGIKIKLSFSKIAEHYGILIKGVLEYVLLINLSKTL